MKVKDLVAHLLQLDQELDVYTAKDAEGNGYSQVYFEPTIMFTPTSTNKHYVEEVFDETDIEDSGYDEDELSPIVVI